MLNIRTVSSFGYESAISHKYDEKMEEPKALAARAGIVAGILYGLSQFFMFLVYGILFYVGSIFVNNHEEVEVEDMFTAVFATIFSGIIAGSNAGLIPDEVACKRAAANLFLIQDSQDEDQIQV